MSNFVKSLQSRPIYGDFSIFQDGGGRHLGFLKFLIFQWSERSVGSNCVILPNFVDDILQFFDFFKTAAVAIVDFGNFEFLMVERVTSVEMRHRAKFRRNRSHRGRNIMRVWLENSRLRPLLGFLGNISPKIMMSLTVLTPKGPSLGRTTSFEP